VSLVNSRPSASNFSYADDLKEFMKATNVRLRLLRTKTLLGHLMAVQNQDPTVTRRVSYLCPIFSCFILMVCSISLGGSSRCKSE